MFGYFKSKTEELNDKYLKLMADAHKLFETDQQAADEKFAEAEKVMQELKQMRQ